MDRKGQQKPYLIWENLGGGYDMAFSVLLVIGNRNESKTREKKDEAVCLQKL